MTAQTAHPGAPIPGSQTTERDAREINTRHHGVAPGEIAIGVIIGRTSEFFDFFVYAIASVLVFPALVFPYVDRLTGTFYSFAIFALAFIARPIGSLIFLRIDALLGRGTKLTIALFLLGGSTAAVAFLPGYETIGGWAGDPARDLPHRPGRRAGRRVGRPRLASRAQRARKPPRLVRDDPAVWARRSG